MKTERRHELQHNYLSDWLAHQSAAIQPYTRAIAGVAVAIAVVIGVYFYISNRSAASLAEGWDQNYFALHSGNSSNFSKTIETHSRDAAGNWARVLLGDQQLSQGSSLLFTDRAEANDQLGKAVDNFSGALSDAPRGDSELRERATWGIAKANEALNKLDKARADYDSLLHDWPDGPYSTLAKQRLESLNRDGTKSFYDWFAKEQPTPPPARKGTMPDFTYPNINGNIKFPSPTDEMNVPPLDNKTGGLNVDDAEVLKKFLEQHKAATDAAKPDGTAPDAKKPSGDPKESPLEPKPDATKDDAAKTDAPKSDDAKTDVPKDDAPKDDAAKPAEVSKPKTSSTKAPATTPAKKPK